MKIELTMVTPEVEISNSAKICYANTTEKDMTSTLVHNHKHLSMLRFAYATFRIEGISRSCANQLVRSKHLDFAQESMRYVNPEKGGFEFIMPENIAQGAKSLMQVHFNNSLKTYYLLTNSGVRKEDARAVLPMNTSTKINVTGSVQAYYDFFKLRLHPKAQHEIRNLAKTIYAKLAIEFPHVFTEALYVEFNHG